MSSVTINVNGKAELERRFDPEKARRLLTMGVFRGLVWVGNAAIRKLSGPVLKNQTGTLRRSIHERIVEDEDPNSIKGVTGSFAGNPNPKGGQQAAGYGRIHEYGGTFAVAEYQRRVSTLFGKPVEPYMQTVKAHSVTYPERSFLRSSLKDEKKNVVKELKLSMDEALRGA